MMEICDRNAIFCQAFAKIRKKMLNPLEMSKSFQVKISRFIFKTTPLGKDWLRVEENLWKNKKIQIYYININGQIFFNNRHLQHFMKKVQRNESRVFDFKVGEYLQSTTNISKAIMSNSVENKLISLSKLKEIAVFPERLGYNENTLFCQIQSQTCLINDYRAKLRSLYNFYMKDCNNFGGCFTVRLGNISYEEVKEIGG